MGKRIFTVLFVFLLLFFLSALINANQLYDDNDKVLLLNSSNFKETIFGTKNAWMVQFFNSWCGHCIAFSPFWKSFAEDVYNWRKIVTVAAVDCSITSNEKLCREYEVHAFPTIKFFKPNTSDDDVGVLYKGSKNVDILRHSMIDFLSTIPEISNLQTKSVFKLKQKSEPISFWENVPHHVKVLILIAEDNNSYVGKEVMLDVLDYHEVSVIRILPEIIPLLKIVKVKNTPTIILLTRSVQHFNESGVDRKLLIKSVASLLSFSSGLESNQEELGGGDEGLGAGDVPQEETSPSDTKSVIGSDQVHLIDLENAIHYTFMQEVPLHKQLDGEKLKALKDFIELLTKYFPGRLSIKKFLQKILDWLNSHSEVLMDEFLQFMNNIQAWDSFLPSMRPWIGCEGSQPNLRGYPCSMWVLFHTLTVEHYNKRNEEQTFNPQLVLKVMTGYIKNFFSCSECAQHFQKMALSFPKEVVQQVDGVLWLWRAHNKVNARLKGSPSEDPQHPKLQFPPKELCSSCYVSADEVFPWDLPEVTHFLVSHYSHIKIFNNSLDNYSESFLDTFQAKSKNLLNHDKTEEIKDKILSRTLNRSQRNINMHMNFEKLSDPIMKSEIRQNPASSWGFNTLDMSLCVMLYLFSAGILLTVYFVVIVKRRLRKKFPLYSNKYSV